MLMNVFYPLMILAGVVLFLLGIVFVLFRRTRPIAGKLVLYGLIMLGFGLWQWTPPASVPKAESQPTDRTAEMNKARALGFGSIEEMERAMQAGYENGALWKAHRAEQAAADEAAEQERQRKANIERAANEEVAAKAGFASFGEYSRALEVGAKTPDEWLAYQARERDRGLLAAARKASGRNVLSVRKMARMNGEALQVELKANGLTAGLDFFDFGTKIGEIAEAIRPHDDGLVELVALLHVGTIDKYGNDAGLSKAAVIVWKLAELQRVNIELGPDYTFRNADEVDLTRFGREMAAAYCGSNDLRDRRYCR